MTNPAIKEFTVRAANNGGISEAILWTPVRDGKQFGLTALLHENSLQLFSEHSPDCKYHPPSEWAKNDVSLALANWAGETLAMRAASGTPPESKTLGLSQDDLLTLAHLDPSGRALRHKATYIGSGDCYDSKAMLIGLAVVFVLGLIAHFYPQWMERLTNLLWWLFAAAILSLALILTALFYRSRRPGLAARTGEHRRRAGARQ